MVIVSGEAVLFHLRGTSHISMLWDLVVFVLGVGSILGGLVAEKTSLERLVLLASGSIAVYVILLLLDTLIYLVFPRVDFHAAMSWRTIYVPGRDPFTRKVAPNLDRIFFYDGHIVHLRTNSRGHRDVELDFRPGEQNVVISGDSFTFGHGLDQEDTIDQQLEHLSSGCSRKMNVYNIGYSASGAKETYSEFSHFDSEYASDYVYMYHGNDITDIMTPDQEIVVFNGMPFYRFRPDGKEYAGSEYAELIERYRDSFNTGVTGIFLLRNLRRIMRPKAFYLFDTGRGAWESIKSLFHIPADAKQARSLHCSSSMRLDTETEEGVRRTLSFVEKMKALTFKRKIRFHVVITPSLSDVTNAEYSSSTIAFICALRDLGVHVIDQAIEELVRTDFIDGDGHYNARGARKVASVMLANL
jgi:hypothetical protein